MKYKSSAKIKRRYLLIEGKKCDVEKAIIEYIGILGWAKATPIFVHVKKEKKIVLSVDRKELVNIRAAFEASPYKIKVLKVSGTIKGLEK